MTANSKSSPKQPRNRLAAAALSLIALITWVAPTAAGAAGESRAADASSDSIILVLPNGTEIENCVPAEVGDAGCGEVRLAQFNAMYWTGLSEVRVPEVMDMLEELPTVIDPPPGIDPPPPTAEPVLVSIDPVIISVAAPVDAANDVLGEILTGTFGGSTCKLRSGPEDYWKYESEPTYIQEQAEASAWTSCSADTVERTCAAATIRHFGSNVFSSPAISASDEDCGRGTAGAFALQDVPYVGSGGGLFDTAYYGAGTEILYHNVLRFDVVGKPQVRFCARARATVGFGFQEAVGYDPC